MRVFNRISSEEKEEKLTGDCAGEVIEKVKLKPVYKCVICYDSGFLKYPSGRKYDCPLCKKGK